MIYGREREKEREKGADALFDEWVRMSAPVPLFPFNCDGGRNRRLK